MVENDHPHHRPSGDAPRLAREEIANQAFPQAFRGLSESAVRAFLRRVADEQEWLSTRNDELLTEIEDLEEQLAAVPTDAVSERDLLSEVGDETARVLRSARESAEEIRVGAEQQAERVVAEAEEEARALREQAELSASERTREADEASTELLEEAERLAREIEEGAEARASELRTQAETEVRTEVESARREAREVLAEAEAARDRTLQELARRKDAIEGQIEALRTGRERLLDAYRVVKRTFEEGLEALRAVDARGSSPSERRSRPPSTARPTVLSPALPADTSGLAHEGSDAAAPDDDGARTPPTDQVAETDDLGEPDEIAETDETDETDEPVAGPETDETDEEPAETDETAEIDAAADVGDTDGAGEAGEVAELGEPEGATEVSDAARAGEPAGVDQVGEAGEPDEPVDEAADVDEAQPDETVAERGPPRVGSLTLGELPDGPVGSGPAEPLVPPGGVVRSREPSGVRIVDAPGGRTEPAAPAEAAEAAEAEGAVGGTRAPDEAERPDETAEPEETAEPGETRETVGAAEEARESDQPHTSETSRTPRPDDVEAIFAKLRAQQEEEPASEESASEEAASEGPESEESVSGGSPAAGEGAAGEGAADEPRTGESSPADSRGPGGAMALLERRDELVAERTSALVRAIKRTVRDEENVVLQGVRQHRTVPDADAVLPAPEEQEQALAATAGHLLGEAVAAGADAARALGSSGSNGSTDAGADSDVVATVVAELVSSVSEPLRTRLSDALSEAATADDGRVEERVRARYREWKGRRVEQAAREALGAAFSRGLYAALPPGVRLRWVTGETSPCPDCEDNTLESVEKGAEFPTGHRGPPAHAGCECLVLPA